jgi:hypothetical protein
MACRIAKVFNEHGARKRGVIRIDSAEFGVEKWREDTAANTGTIVSTFKEAAKIAADHGERLAAEGEICWAGMHSWKDMLDVLEGVGMPEALGFQADLAHTYLYTLGYNAPEHALVQEGYNEEEFWPAYEKMTDALRPWTIDFHVAQNDGEVHGAGSHDKTGKHCPADDPNGKLDITRCASYWLKDASDRGIEHICWDGCMFPNATLENPDTWNTILKAMIDVRDAHGQNYNQNSNDERKETPQYRTGGLRLHGPHPLQRLQARQRLLSRSRPSPRAQGRVRSHRRQDQGLR